jgi:hypothetical protein
MRVTQRMSKSASSYVAELGKLKNYGKRFSSILVSDSLLRCIPIDNPYNLPQACISMGQKSDRSVIYIQPSQNKSVRFQHAGKAYKIESHHRSKTLVFGDKARV